MKQADTTGPALVAIFGLGAVLLNFPILSIFTRPADVGGVPVLFAFVFVVWLLLIALTALAVERPPD